MLDPIILSRRLDFSPPLTAPGDAVLDAIAQELRRHGNRIRHKGNGSIRFDGPGLFYVSLSVSGRAAVLVSHGTVTLDPQAPERTLRLELGMSWWLVYGWPCLMAAVMVAMDFPVAGRVIMLIVLAGLAWTNYDNAKIAYEDWISTAVRRASPPT
jgi:hypothetical protein